MSDRVEPSRELRTDHAFLLVSSAPDGCWQGGPAMFAPAHVRPGREPAWEIRLSPRPAGD